jgi:hypothetical protein
LKTEKNIKKAVYCENKLIYYFFVILNYSPMSNKLHAISRKKKM